MASFTREEYAATVAAAQKKESGVKIGYFKLADGGEALVRFNVPSIDSLDFASIHRVKRNPEDRFCGMSISCLNPLGKTGECPLCEAVEAGNPNVQKVGKRVFVKVLVSYKDPTTGAWGKPEPVIWERPAGFYKELMTLINEYGSLVHNLFKITRTGSSLDTKYSINYAVPTVYKPELIPEDFSAFNNFNIKKHSYWEKTYEEVEEYLNTGSFPEVIKTETTKSVETPKVVEKPKVVEHPAVTEEELPFPTATETPTEPVIEEKPADDGFKFSGFTF